MWRIHDRNGTKTTEILDDSTRFSHYGVLLLWDMMFLIQVVCLPSFTRRLEFFDAVVPFL